MAYTHEQALGFILDHLSNCFTENSGVAYGSALITDDDTTTLAALVHQLRPQPSTVNDKPFGLKVSWSVSMTDTSNIVSCFVAESISPTHMCAYIADRDREDDVQAEDFSDYYMPCIARSAPVNCQIAISSSGEFGSYLTIVATASEVARHSLIKRLEDALYSVTTFDPEKQSWRLFG